MDVTDREKGMGGAFLDVVILQSTLCSACLCCTTAFKHVMRGIERTKCNGAFSAAREQPGELNTAPLTWLNQREGWKARPRKMKEKEESKRWEVSHFYSIAI